MHQVRTIHIIFSCKILTILKRNTKVACTVNYTHSVIELNLNVKVNMFPFKIKGNSYNRTCSG